MQFGIKEHFCLKDKKMKFTFFRAMSCFENRDFEGLKVAMRKMPNSQATGEELGRSISCGWDMEAFDMLATVETLKGVSKRRYKYLRKF
jgi:hypothetical protein